MTPAPDPPVHLGMDRPPLVAGGRLLVGNATRGGLVARDVTVLRSRWQRARLAFARRLEGGRGLLAAGLEAVHSLGARHGLRILALDEEDRVLDEVLLRPWRTARLPPGTCTAVLLHQDNPATVRPGDRLEWLAAQPRLPGRADWLEEGAPGGETT